MFVIMGLQVSQGEVKTDSISGPVLFVWYVSIPTQSSTI